MLFVFSKFKRHKWIKYSPEKRLLILRALEKKIAKWLDIEPLKLEVRYGDTDWNCFGAFTVVGKIKKIELNENLIYEPRFRFHAMETIAHETRHAYQFMIVKRDLKWYEFTAKKWKRNWEGYFASADDNIMYNNQSIERDAQKYSLKILKKRKYPDEDYKLTLAAVQHRYDQADLDARKKYGFFYKYKIEKNIAENSKDIF